MRKIYVLDTNVLLQDPYSIFAFQKNEVVLPAVVLEEVDSKKRNMDEIGRNARQISKLIDQLREKGKLHEGVPLDSGGSLRVELNHRSFKNLKESFAEMTNDNRIIAVALNLSIEESEKKNGSKVTLVSKDALVRVKADAFGLDVEDFLNDRVVEFDEGYDGYIEVYVDKDIIKRFYDNGGINRGDLSIHTQLYPHQFVILKDSLGGSSSALGKIEPNGFDIRPFVSDSDQVWGIRSRNVQQKNGV